MTKKDASLKGQGKDIVGVDKFFGTDWSVTDEQPEEVRPLVEEGPSIKVIEREIETTEREKAKETILNEETQFVVFTLAKETYGLPVTNVREIVTLTKITAVPRSQDYVSGIVNLRGSVVPVLNFHRRLGLPETETTAHSRIMVVELGKEEVGLLVDGVSEVIRISPDKVGAPSELLSGPEGDYLTGVANIDDRLILLLDIYRILDKKIIVE